jgi:NADPH:quinone reductase
VRIRVLASGLEYTDVTIRRHLYPQTAARRPLFVLGYDVVGEIDQLGAYRTLRADHLARLPAGIDAAEAATLILSWTTAYQLCTAPPGYSEVSACLCMEPPARGRPGDDYPGQAGRPRALGRSAREHAAFIRDLGAMPIDYQREDFARVLPGGFDVVFDGIGKNGYRRLRRSSRAACFAPTATRRACRHSVACSRS